MPSKRKYFLEGKIFGQLHVIEFCNGKYKCKCKCGKEKYILICDLTRRKYKSCGCERRIDDKFYNKRFLQRFKAKTERLANGCLKWNGFVNQCGYPRISYKGKAYLGNRLIWELNFGKIPEGKLICHTCDNPNCLELKHLYIGTPKDNMQDCILRKRHKTPIGSESTNTKLTEYEVNQIKIAFSKGVTIRYISKKYNIGKSTAFRIKNGVTWKHVNI